MHRLAKENAQLWIPQCTIPGNWMASRFTLTVPHGHALCSAFLAKFVLPLVWIKQLASRDVNFISSSCTKRDLSEFHYHSFLHYPLIFLFASFLPHVEYVASSVSFYACQKNSVSLVPKRKTACSLPSSWSFLHSSQAATHTHLMVGRLWYLTAANEVLPTRPFWPGIPTSSIKSSLSLADTVWL